MEATGTKDSQPNGPGTRIVRRHELWRIGYRNRRYLRHVSEAELIQRLRDMMNNLTVLTEDGKIGVHEVGPEGEFWFIKFTHVLEEVELRNMGVPVGFMTDSILPEPVCPRHKESWESVLRNLPAGAVVKYGKLEHLRAALDRGHIRVCPASWYSKSQDQHRKDDERVRRAYWTPETVRIQLARRADGAEVAGRPELKPNGNVTVRSEYHDYYVWCAAHRLTPRLLVDFRADACLIIHDPRAFGKRLTWGIKEAICRAGLTWRSLLAEGREVSYYDPYDPPRPPNDRLDVPWQKPIQFAYQREWRFVADLSPPPTTDLPLLNTDIGPLGDIAEVLHIGEVGRV